MKMTTIYLVHSHALLRVEMRALSLPLEVAEVLPSLSLVSRKKSSWSWVL
jgi:hypothetical protein